MLSSLGRRVLDHAANDSVEALGDSVQAIAMGARFIGKVQNAVQWLRSKFNRS